MCGYSQNDIRHFERVNTDFAICGEKVGLHWKGIPEALSANLTSFKEIPQREFMHSYKRI